MFHASICGALESSTQTKVGNCKTGCNELALVSIDSKSMKEKEFAPKQNKLGAEDTVKVTDPTYLGGENKAPKLAK